MKDNYRIIKISDDDLMFDSRQAAEVINNACIRDKTCVVGVCKVHDVLLVYLEPSELDNTYVFSQFENDNVDAIASEINSRFLYEFSVISGFFINKTMWGLFKKRNLNE